MSYTKKKLPKQNSSVFYKPHTRTILPIKKIKQYFIKVIQSTIFCSTLKNKRTQKKLIFYTRSKKWVKKLTCPYITSGISCGNFSWVLPLFLLGLWGRVATRNGRLVVVFGQKGEFGLHHEVLRLLFLELLNFPVSGSRVAPAPALLPWFWSLSWSR